VALADPDDLAVGNAEVDKTGKGLNDDVYMALQNVQYIKAFGAEAMDGRAILEAVVRASKSKFPGSGGGVMHTRATSSAKPAAASPGSGGGVMHTRATSSAKPAAASTDGEPEGVPKDDPKWNKSRKPPPVGAKCLECGKEAVHVFRGSWYHTKYKTESYCHTHAPKCTGCGAYADHENGNARGRCIPCGDPC
jgi:hypothetical protein